MYCGLTLPIMFKLSRITEVRVVLSVDLKGLSFDKHSLIEMHRVFLGQYIGMIWVKINFSKNVSHGCHGS